VANVPQNYNDTEQRHILVVCFGKDWKITISYSNFFQRTTVRPDPGTHEMAEALAATRTTEEVGVRQMQRRRGIRRSGVGISAASRILPKTRAAATQHRDVIRARPRWPELGGDAKAEPLRRRRGSPPSFVLPSPKNIRSGLILSKSCSNKPPASRSEEEQGRGRRDVRG
jgi:hypothetical protein